LEPLKEHLEINLDYFDEYDNILRNLKEELENADPVLEGGSDSESSDEDVPLKIKKKFRNKVSKIISTKMAPNEKKKKISKKKQTHRNKEKRSSTAKPASSTANTNTTTNVNITRNFSNSNLLTNPSAKKIKSSQNFYNQTLNFKEDASKKDKNRNPIRTRTNTFLGADNTHKLALER
jgi:CCR4-NOT transcriptional regulation complex NOT5 subunit